MIVTAIQSFDHCGKAYRFGDTPNVTSATAQALAQKGLVSLTGLPAENPHQAAGMDSPSSASQAAQALPQPTLNESGDGDLKPVKRRKKKAAAE